MTHFMPVHPKLQTAQLILSIFVQCKGFFGGQCIYNKNAKLYCDAMTLNNLISSIRISFTPVIL